MTRTTRIAAALGAGVLAGCAAAPPPAPAPAPAGPTCDAAACNTLGMQALERARRGEAVDLLDRACSLGHAVGCSNLAGVLRGGAGADPPRAAALYERACGLGFAEACASLGSILAEGKLVPADAPRALAMYDRACAGADAFGCFTAGLLLAEGRGVPRSAEAATERFDRACGLGHATGCYNAGLLLFRERGARPGENERAAQLFGRACDGQQPAGCMRLGIATLRGQGAGPDPARARELFDRACRAGDGDGCEAAAQLARGKGGKDTPIALTSSAPALTMGGLRVLDLSCRMPEVGPMALGEAIEALAAHKPALDACAPAGEAPRVTWSWQGQRAGQVKVVGGGAKVEACVRRAVERARAGLRGGCSAVLLIGDPEGAQRVRAARQSAPTTVAVRAGS
jgi:TPR repeat protein